ncbi:vWA domain-containing protein [Palleronia sp. LCG004]|uniref:vWA domain-containing protein n=1 Tax=Palleronia sp. LCG004 TaxID=3079304 RepID=UPI002943F699|nr:VWA domain-containing protein [Palleronia sp. LCG004]WOI55178.1 VWA domain-containing protein [Palleronia sp. LCG004]
MFLPFFTELRARKVPVGLGEFLDFLAVLKTGLVIYDVDGFYHLARATLVKRETHLDRFDQAFAAAFRGIEAIPPEAVLDALDLPEDWLRTMAEKHLTPEERAEIEALGGFDALMKALRERLEQQQDRHEGGSKWIGTAGTSPFGAQGYNPEGVRIGQESSRQRRAVKVWDRREFRNLDDDRELGTRNIKVALKRLRRWAREGTEEELDLPATIRSTARNGYLDVQTRPERRNAIRVLLFLDVGGSMDEHVDVVSDLFSAARSEFRHLEQFYFHNCLYEGVWRDNRRRRNEQVPTWDVIHRYGPEWRCIFVGDAAMSPYEVAVPGGANEHWNAEAGATWLARAADHWPAHLWINPAPEVYWSQTRSTRMIAEILAQDRMVPMTLDGLTRGMKALG